MDTNLPEERSANEVNSQLAMLIEISHVFGSEMPAREAFQQLLEILKQRHGVIQGVVFLLDAESREIRIEVSSMSDAAGSTGYRLGEGITGRVVETGKPMVVPQVSRE